MASWSFRLAVAVFLHWHGKVGEWEGAVDLRSRRTRSGGAAFHSDQLVYHSIFSDV